jgi:hypothetical protein
MDHDAGGAMSGSRIHRAAQGARRFAIQFDVTEMASMASSPLNLDNPSVWITFRSD